MCFEDVIINGRDQYNNIKVHLRRKRKELMQDV